MRVPWVGGARRFRQAWWPLVLGPTTLALGARGGWSNALQTALCAAALGWAVLSSATLGTRGGFLPCWLAVDHALAFGAFAAEVAPRLPAAGVAWGAAVFGLMAGLHVAVRHLDPGTLPSLPLDLDPGEIPPAAGEVLKGEAPKGEGGQGGAFPREVFPPGGLSPGRGWTRTQAPLLARYQ